MRISCVFHAFSMRIPCVFHAYFMRILCVFHAFSMCIPCVFMRISCIFYAYSVCFSCCPGDLNPICIPNWRAAWKTMEDRYTDIINMARKFTSMVEDTRKKELMSRKTARQSLDFDSPPAKPAQYRHQQFTPPRHAREQIRKTQNDDDGDDYERDSLCSSQTGSTRIRLQERWKIVGTRNKATTSTKDFKKWIEEHAHAEMAKAGQFEDLKPAPTDVGGWKRAHVSNCTLFNVVKFVQLIWICTGMQIHHLYPVCCCPQVPDRNSSRDNGLTSWTISMRPIPRERCTPKLSRSFARLVTVCTLHARHSKLSSCRRTR
jgi:hypothetical protein